MLEFPYRELKRFLLVYRLTFAATRRFQPPRIQIESDSRGVRLTASNGQFVVRQEMGYRDESRPLLRLAVDHSLLIQISASDDHPIRLDCQGDTVSIDWEERGVPQQLTATAQEFGTGGSSNQSLQAEPIVPSNAYRSNDQFLQALREAYLSTDQAESGRYALDAILMDGETGVLAGTDGRQALIQREFCWPWSDKRLIPGCRLFGSVAWLKLARKEGWQIQVWQQQEAIWMQFGSTSLGMAIVEARFPNLELLQTDESQAITSMSIDEVDAQFLGEKIGSLPSSDRELLPVVIELNGEVAVRGNSGSQQPAIALVLSNSDKTGSDLEISTNRNYLARAVSLGFRKISINPSGNMAFSNEDTRTFTWGLLMVDKSVQPPSASTRICSPMRGPWKSDPAAARSSDKPAGIKPPLVSV